MITHEQLIKARLGMLALTDELKNTTTRCRLARTAKPSHCRVWMETGTSRPGPASETFSTG